MGSFKPECAELPAELVRRATCYVDTLEGARTEAGDLLQADVDWSRVTPLERIVDAAAPVTAPGPVVFKGVGHALFDLAAAATAVDQGLDRVHP